MLYFCEAVYVWISSLPARDLAFASPKGEKTGGLGRFFF